MSAIVMPPNVEPLSVSVELQPYHAHPTDNALNSDVEINRFFMGDKSTIGLIDVMKGMSVYTLAECCNVAGPQLWRLCAFMRSEFARLFHCSKYEPFRGESLKSITENRIALRKVFTDFYTRWSRMTASTRNEKVHFTSYQNQRGQLMNPVHPRGAPAFRSYSNEVPNEFIEQWFDGKGALSRWETNSKGEVVDYKFGFPCSIIARCEVVDHWYEFDDTVNDFVRHNEYGTAIGLQYQTVEGRIRFVQVIPDSDSEFTNFRDGGCSAYHPLVKRYCPNILDLLLKTEE